MSLVIQLSGYDKKSELIAAEHPVPASRLDEVKAIAGVPKSDPTVMGAYPLDEAQAVQIAGRINTPINPKLYDWFIQGYEDA
jgi:hypothetical protein